MESLDKYDNEEVQLKNSLVRIGDLINIDGPMLVVFKNITSQDFYLFDWVDNNNKSNRWLIYKVDKKDLIHFLKTKISYKTLFEKNSSTLYFTDIESEEFQAFKIFKLKGLPLGYKPDKDVLFDLKDSKNLDKILKNLNLDNNLNGVDYSKEYNMIELTFKAELTGQNISHLWPSHIKANVLNIKIQNNLNYTQPHASKSNRLPEQKGLVLQ